MHVRLICAIKFYLLAYLGQTDRPTAGHQTVALRFLLETRPVQGDMAEVIRACACPDMPTVDSGQ